MTLRWRQDDLVWWEMTGLAKVSFGPQTLGAMVVALVVYVFVSFFAITVVTGAIGLLDYAAEWVFPGSHPNLVQLVGAVIAAVAGVWAARLVCDLVFSAYLARAVFWMLLVVLTMTTLGKASLNLTATQVILAAQYLAALGAAYHYFWRGRSAISLTAGLVESD